MSITVSTDVFCDGDGCSMWVAGVTGPRSDKKTAEKIAHLAGWKITSRRYLCPACKKKETDR